VNELTHESDMCSLAPPGSNNFQKSMGRRSSQFNQHGKSTEQKHLDRGTSSIPKGYTHIHKLEQ